MPRKGQLSGHFCNCENCNKEIYQTNTQYNRAKHHFCSNKCQKEFQHNLAYENRKCEICGNEFETSKKSTKRFCSNKCQNIWQSKQIGELNPRYNRINYKCDYCNNEIKIMPCENNLFKYHFCSDECRKQWYSKTFSQNEEWKEESRKRAVKILETNFNNTNTKPQIIINEILDSMNVEYVNEKGFVYYAVDNYLNQQNLIIEVMGDFWHASPIKYDYDNLRDIQKKRIPKDKAKHTFIKNKYGIEILYLWESDILNNKVLCEKLIKLYINNNGKLDNYHSFNYILSDNVICLKQKIITPYQDINIA